MRHAPSRWDRVEAFCMFVGYGRSGHSALGSLLDAHPRAAVSHELNAVKRFFQGVPRDVLFDEIFALAQQQARDGRYATRAGGGTYTHNLPGQAKTDASGIILIGDKKGAGTAWQFAQHGLEHIERFKTYIGVPVRILHVIRNPFDIVAAGMALGRKDFSRTVAVVSRIRERHSGADWRDVYYEDLLARPAEEIERIVTFLGLPLDAEHQARSAAYLYRVPHQRRFEVEWPEGVRAMVDDLIARHEYLGRYRWDS